MGTTPWPGLTGTEVTQQRAKYGLNLLEQAQAGGWRVALRSIAGEPMFLLLLAGAAIYLLIGDLADGLLLGTFALLTVGLVLWQERRSQRALVALRALAAPLVRVRRDGSVETLLATDLVPGDVCELSEGDRVAADGVLREGVAVAVDESLLTGESLAVAKQACAARSAAPLARPGGDGGVHLYAGTLIVAGHGLLEVKATGRNTQIGQIGLSLATIDDAPTPLQVELRRIVRFFGLAALLACLFLLLWSGLQRGDWLQGLLSAIALGMAMLPEEFPVVLAIFLALGAWRMARLQVLARRPAVIEALGAATVLCVDKTGTLTENRIQLQRLVSVDADLDLDVTETLPEAVQRMLRCGVLASLQGSADPIDRAVMAAAERRAPADHPDWRLVREYPLSAGLLAATYAWTRDDGRLYVASKGAPEAICALSRLDATSQQRWLEQAQQLASAGLRVLAVAEAVAALDEPARNATDYDFHWLGLLGFADPLRPSVPAAVAEAQGAGLRVVMITGDHAATGLSIARQAGLNTAAGALTGADLAALDDVSLTEVAGEISVYARMLPEQKLRLVQALQRRGETVAMTGDGVNDAPALKAAHIGIAMGKRGTDVAREAAGLVLLEEDFGRIVDAIRMGRRIYTNLCKVAVYIMAIHVPIIGLALLPILMGLPPLLLPAHVVLTEMVIDPACSLAFEATDDPDAMRRPPRPKGGGLWSWGTFSAGLIQGLCLLTVTLLCYQLALAHGRGEDIARTLAVLGLTLGNLLLVAVNICAGTGLAALFALAARAYWFVASAAAASLLIALWLPAGRELLQFAVPSAADLLAMAAAVIASVAVGARLSRRTDR